MNFVHTNLAHLLQTFGGALWPPGADQALAAEKAQAMAAGVALQGIQTLSHAGPAHLAFLSNPKYREQLQHTRAPVVLVREAQVQALAAALRSLGTRPMLWAVPDPYLMYAKLQQWWVAQSQPAKPPGVHPSAVLHPSSQVHPSAHVGAQVCIAEGVVVGEGVVLEPGVVLGAGVHIGAYSRLCAHVVVYADCQLGAHCLVHAGAVIGADGFGFAHEAGQWVKIPQVGRVLVGDHVEIGANTTIDRGALGDTVIGTGVKLDNQIQIAHNVHIGEHTAMAGFAGVAGSTHIGARCMIGGAASILGHLHIADGTQVSANTCIMSSITEPGVYTGIYPTQPHKDWERTAATVRQLNKLRKQWRKA